MSSRTDKQAWEARKQRLALDTLRYRNQVRAAFYQDNAAAIAEMREAVAAGKPVEILDGPAAGMCIATGADISRWVDRYVNESVQGV